MMQKISEITNFEAVFKASNVAVGDFGIAYVAQRDMDKYRLPSVELDPAYSQEHQYDLLRRDDKESFAKLEVKTMCGRAQAKQERTLASIVQRAILLADNSVVQNDKALDFDDDRSYLVNFLHVKPKEADAFILLCVWKNRIEMWVINGKEALLLSHKHYSKNDRQIKIDRLALRPYRVEYADLDKAIVDAIKRDGPVITRLIDVTPPMIFT